MAKGQVFSIPSNTAILRNTQANTEKQSLALLNPNDGVVYIAIDRAADSSLSGWDWKLPSQSYGAFPGPWTSVGLYYLDQSGTGVAGEFNLYDVDTQLYIPDIHSVGRALQARQNTLDITQGNQPPAPAIGVERVWADNVNVLHALDSSDVDRLLLDSAHLITAALIAVGATSQPLFATSVTSTSTTSTTDVDMLDMAVNITTSGGPILAIHVSSNYNNLSGGWDRTVLVLDGGASVAIAMPTAPSANYEHMNANIYLFTGVAAGAHTIKTRWSTQQGTFNNGGRRSLFVMEILR